LRKLFLDQNQLKALPPGIFKQLTRLRSLLIHANQLSELPEGVFEDLIRLKTLVIALNELSKQEIAKINATFAGRTGVTLELGDQLLGPNIDDPKEVPQGTECAICLESEGLNYKTSCGHYFHARHIAQWVRSQPKPLCPTCRQNIFTGTPRYSRTSSPQTTEPEVQERQSVDTTVMRRVRSRRGRRPARRRA